MILTLVLSTLGGLLTGAATTLWTPFIKERFDRRQEAAQLRNRYSPPLLQAAFDLQSRFYNIVRLGFLKAYMRTGGDLQSYAEYSTLWLLAQYLGWVEILRREVQFLDFGKRKRNRALQEALGNVAAALATDVAGGSFAVFRTEQRAIGELMIAAGGDEKVQRTASLGYAEFVKRLDDPSVGRWFSRLRQDLAVIGSEGDYERLIRVQRALVELVDELDPDRIRYPVLDLRGKLPLKQGVSDTPFGGFERVAHFVARPDEYGADDKSFPGQFLASWQAGHELRPLTTDDPKRWEYEWLPGPFARRLLRFGGRLVVHVLYDTSRITVYAAVSPPRWVRRPPLNPPLLPVSSGGWRFRASRRRARAVVNDLLHALDRPLIE